MAGEAHAFMEVCKAAQPAKSIYVSLYTCCPWYGGPEEGGWWGEDHALVAYQHFDTDEAADVAQAAITKLAEELSRTRRDEFGDLCLQQLDWCEQRGIDDSNAVFGEVDGESSYFVVREDSPGSQNYRGERCWS